MGLLAKLGLPVALAAGGAVLAGASLGAMNGALVAGLGLPSIVVTLATMVAWREGLRWATEGTWVRGLPESFQWLGLGQTAGRLLIVATAAAVFAVVAWGLASLRAGRSVYATGSDAEAARLLGLRPRRVTFFAFVAMGALTGLAAVLTTVQFIDVQPNAGVGLELRIIAAVVVGGVAIVTSLRLPPLIVTLGTYSLYRGLAEAATGGVANYTGFPDAFLGLGQGSFAGGIPAQLPLLAVAFLCFWLLVHRSVIGRGLEAIGYAPEAARHAGVPVGSRLRLVYVLSGTIAGVASLVYVARLGQAKGRRRHGLRAARDHGRGPRRHLDLRRPRECLRHAAGALRPRAAAERPAPRRPARRAGGDPHGCASAAGARTLSRERKAS